MKELRKIIGQNLQDLRKQNGYTQTQIGEQFNYSDKAVSKWENGDTLPDIETLYQICEFYGVTIDYLTHEENLEQYVNKESKNIRTNKIVVMSLLSMMIWLIATIIYVYLFISGKNVWIIFVWAFPINALTIVLLNAMYFKNRILYFIAYSAFVWTGITAIFLQSMSYVLARPIFLVGIPAQISLVLWLNMKPINKNKKKKTNDQTN